MATYLTARAGYFSGSRETEKWIYERRRKDFENGCRESWRLLCGGVVIAQHPSRHGEEFCKRMLGYLKGHIVSAITDPNWVFDGIGKETGPQWLAWQEDRLGMKLSLDLEIVPPGERFELCPRMKSGDLDA